MTREKLLEAETLLLSRYLPHDKLKEAIVLGLDYLSQRDELAARLEETLREEVRLSKALAEAKGAKEEMEKKLGKNEEILAEALAVAKALEAALPDKESSIPLSNRYHDLLSLLERN